jgi:ribonuclease HI
MNKLDEAWNELKRSRKATKDAIALENKPKIEYKVNEFSNRKTYESVQTIVTRRHEFGSAYIAWTDGSCDPNPGPGGWGYVIEHAGASYTGFGGDPDTSNNRMEMQAVIDALRACKSASSVIVRTDSQLVVLCAVGRWKKKANLDLWRDLERLCAGRRVAFEWWRGHVGTAGNERADELARMGREGVWSQFKCETQHLRSIIG